MNTDFTRPEFSQEFADRLVDEIVGKTQHATAELLARFAPEELVAHYIFEGSSWSAPLIYNMPKGIPIGGIYVENQTAAGSVNVFLGTSSFGEPLFEVGPGNFKAYPVNQYDGYSTVTIALDVASAGRVRVILCSKKLGPAQGSTM